MPHLHLRLHFGSTRFGPGKAELLRLIAETGSISAAGRAMGMSYKRAWSLVEELNASFAVPLVISARGGAGGGGAQLSEQGAFVLERFQIIEAKAASAVEAEIAALERLLATEVAADMSKRK